MRTLKLLVLLLSPIALGGCSLIQGGKLMAPEIFGLTSISPGLYIEASANEATRAQLRDAMERAESAIRSAYGSVTSRPTVHACVSDGCYENFGGRGSTAKVYYDRILLSPRGLNWHYLAHEWSHAEILARLRMGAWWNLPRWFDEGVAVAVSDAPEHSESHWQFLVATQVPRPSPEELRSLRSLRDWNDAVGHYGEKNNRERRTRGEPEIRPVYAAAGHELRPWLAMAGNGGLIRLLEQLNAGVEFESAYSSVAITTE